MVLASIWIFEDVVHQEVMNHVGHDQGRGQCHWLTSSFDCLWAFGSREVGPNEEYQVADYTDDTVGKGFLPYVVDPHKNDQNNKPYSYEGTDQI